MVIQEHAPLISNRRAANAITCHRSSRGCTCQGSSKVKKFERRMVKKSERQAFRVALKNGEY